MKIGYARVSTVDQNLEGQIEQLKAAGCEKIFVEKVTGTSTKKRHQLKEAIEYIREGDTLVVTKIDRMARSIIDLNKIVSEVAEKGASVLFLKENMEFSSDRKANSLQTLLFNVLGAFAQFERDMIVERTDEGKVRAKRQGKHMGRPAKPQQDILRALKLFTEREANGMSVNDIAALTGVPRSTIYAKIGNGGLIEAKKDQSIEKGS